MGSKTGKVSKSVSLVVYCPKCGEKLQIITKRGVGAKGTFWSCGCGFEDRHSKGSYKMLEHRFIYK